MVAPWAARQPIMTPMEPRHPDNVRDDEMPSRPNQWTSRGRQSTTSFEQLVNELMDGLPRNTFHSFDNIQPTYRTS